MLDFCVPFSVCVPLDWERYVSTAVQCEWNFWNTISARFAFHWIERGWFILNLCSHWTCTAYRIKCHKRTSASCLYRCRPDVSSWKHRDRDTGVWPTQGENTQHHNWGNNRKSVKEKSCFILVDFANVDTRLWQVNRLCHETIFKVCKIFTLIRLLYDIIWALVSWEFNLISVVWVLAVLRVHRRYSLWLLRDCYMILIWSFSF